MYYPLTLILTFSLIMFACSNDPVSSNDDPDPDPDPEPVSETIITMDNSGAQAYVITEIDGDGAEAETDSGNPQIALQTGQRFTFINNGGASSHPLDFRNSDGSKLIGQSNDTGSFDGNEDIELEMDGDQISFILTEDLAAELALYVCAFHPGMTGPIVSN